MLPSLHTIQARLSLPGAGNLLAPELYRFTPWMETVAITFFACLLGWLANPEDPLFLHSGFPWLWLAPILIALRYGVMPGVLSILGLLANWMLFTELSDQVAELPRAYFVGGVLLTLICGEFNNVWSSRNERHTEANMYLSERLNRLTRRYLLLRLSHDRIEQELLGKPGSLRDALVQLREITPGVSAENPLPNIDALLELMAQYCQLEAAAIYPPPLAKGDRLTLGPSLATIGEPQPLQADDPMLQKVMEQHTLFHIAEQAEAQQLVIAPILTSDDQILGLFAVSHMPFFALNHENLQLIELLLGYYADIVHVSNDVQALRRQLPDCPWAFVEELVRVEHIQREIGLDSHVVVFRFSGDKAFEIAGEMERMRRTLDVIWPVDHEAQPALAVLLPLSSAAASEEYILRIENWLKERYGIGGDVQGAEIIKIPVGQNSSVARLRSALFAEEATP